MDITSDSLVISGGPTMRDTKKWVGRFVLATVVGGGLLAAPPTGLAGQPAPLPIQIPIRDVGEPPTPAIEGQAFAPAPVVSHRRRPWKKRRHAVRRRRPPKRLATPPPKAAPVAGKSGPRLEQRPEAATESILPLDLLPGPDGAAPAKGSAAKPVAPAKATSGPQAASAPKAEPKPAPAPAELPPQPGKGATPPAAPAKP